MRLVLPERLRESLGRRGAAFFLALAIELLLALLLLWIAPVLPEKKPPPKTTVFGIETPRGAADEPEKTPQKARASTPAAREKAPVPQPKPPETPPPPPVVVVPNPASPPSFVRMTRREYAAADIAKMQSAPADASAATDTGDAAKSSGGGSAGDSDVASVKGKNGEKLYVAEWVREPTHAELQPYISQYRARTSGFGEVACRTVARNRVEDCYEIGETRGSGLAGSVRQAAFQFLVRPPRVGRVLKVGEWVLIRIDYTITNK
ncbi:hypothetical protein AB2M62_17145 [Sphingomonas sp. MMS12-HWE2-04]|uniref:hypothetical protein n=1 Tax=Sphingomonas sp. MMS12-HWE2-04 TaxID=3234199 RepID=UPI00384D7D3A